MTLPATTTRFGEVVEASIERLLGQCHALYEAPVLGTLVRAGESVYGAARGAGEFARGPTRPAGGGGAGAAAAAEG